MKVQIIHRNVAHICDYLKSRCLALKQIHLLLWDDKNHFSQAEDEHQLDKTDGILAFYIAAGSVANLH